MSFSGLCNDNVEETFNLKHELHGKMFPCSFIKIGEWAMRAVSQSYCFLKLTVKIRIICIVSSGVLILHRKKMKLCNIFSANCAIRRVYYAGHFALFYKVSEEENHFYAI